LQNDVLLRFFATGTFSFWIPLVGPYFNSRVPEAPQTLDYLGLNYYSHMFMKFRFDLKDPIISEGSPEDKQCNVMTDMEYPIYAEGFYLAIKRISQINPKLPIYITENGVADIDDSRRRLFLKRYIYAMSKAIEDGCDVRGYFYWTLMDNFEWAFGYDMCFGLYQVDYGKNQDGVGATLKRKFRVGSEYFREVAKRFSK
jgi:beta-glucosidase